MVAPNSSGIIGVFGASGFGREVMSMLLQQLTKSEVRERIVFVERKAAPDIFDVPVWHQDEFFANKATRSFVLAIADGRIRRRLFELAVKSGARPIEVRSGSAEVFHRTKLGAGAILCGNSIVSCDASIGLSLHLNVGSYLAHDCRVGDFVTFGPHVLCAGNVVIEDDAYIGGGAMIRQGKPDRPLVIGAGAVIGMGAVVTKDVPPGVTVIGNPAKLLARR